MESRDAASSHYRHTMEKSQEIPSCLVLGSIFFLGEHKWPQGQPLQNTGSASVRWKRFVGDTESGLIDFQQCFCKKLWQAVVIILSLSIQPSTEYVAALIHFLGCKFTHRGG